MKRYKILVHLYCLVTRKTGSHWRKMRVLGGSTVYFSHAYAHEVGEALCERYSFHNSTGAAIKNRAVMYNVY